jgi:hypothetical protein
MGGGGGVQATKAGLYNIGPNLDFEKTMPKTLGSTLAMQM